MDAPSMDTLAPLPEVLRAVGISKPQVYKLMARGEFPRCVKCGSASRWVRSEIAAWIAARVAERDAEAVR